jgi:hypothetical protein
MDAVYYFGYQLLGTIWAFSPYTNPYAAESNEDISEGLISGST